MGTLYGDQTYTGTVSCLILVGMKNVSDDSCRENQNKFYIQENIYENRVVYEMMCENMVEPDRSQMTMYGSCWITNAMDTQSQYAILIVFPLYQWLRERA